MFLTDCLEWSIIVIFSIVVIFLMLYGFDVIYNKMLDEQYSHPDNPLGPVYSLPDRSNYYNITRNTTDNESTPYKPEKVHIRSSSITIYKYYP